MRLSQRSRRHNRIRRGAIREEQGEAMIMAACILMILIFLSLSALLAAASSMKTGHSSAASVRCRMAAVTFSRMLEEELTEEGAGEQNTFQNAVEYMIRNDDTYTYYWDGEKEGMVWNYTLQSGGRGLEELMNGYDIRLGIYWGNTTCTLYNRKNLSASEDPLKYTDTYLYTQVTCTKGDMGYEVRQKYRILTQSESEADTENDRWQFIKEG